VSEFLEIMQQFYPAVIVGSAVIIILLFGELAIHKLYLRHLALKDEDCETATSLTNDGLLAAGVSCAGAWLLMAITAGNASGTIVQFLTVMALLVGAVGGVVLYIRIRFKG
jgi:hypothetical protein